MAGTVPLETTDTTIAGQLWPVGDADGWVRWLRGAALVIGGAALLTLSAKVQVPGPVPMTLQTLAVLALGAALGARHAVLAVTLYLLEGALGLPVFANTPPLPAGIGYFAGPTGGFMGGFLVAAALVGAATDRGWAKRPLAFAAAVATADAAMLACGLAWLACFATVGGGFGLGWGKAFSLGVAPFLLGEIVKVALASLALPVLLSVASRLRRG